MDPKQHYWCCHKILVKYQFGFEEQRLAQLQQMTEAKGDTSAKIFFWFS
jgi:hypothetical protein